MRHTSPSPIRGFWYYLRCRALGLPLLVNLEFTKRCNARCSFCTSWQLSSDGELSDYGPVIKKFRPVVVSVSGGEPLLRKNYPELLSGIRPYCHYLSIITNGALLNKNSAANLVDAGVNQICVSLDFLGQRHDETRGIVGIYDHLAETIPALAREGLRITLNTVIMESNLGEVLPIAHRAAEWGVSVSYSAYCPLKNDNEDQMVRQERYAQLVAIVDEIMKLKSSLRHIKNSNYYLERLPAYFRDGRVSGCRAGRRWLQVTPDGYVQQCSELPRICHYTEFSRERLAEVTCAKCWYACRGEAQAQPLNPRRLMELIRA